MAMRQRPKLPQKIGRRLHYTHVRGDRLHDYRRNPRAMVCKACIHGGKIVVPGDQSQSRQFSGNPGTVGNSEGQRARASPDQQRIRMAVITAVKFHDHWTARCGAGDPQRRHARLGARTLQPHFLRDRYCGADPFGQFDLQAGWFSVAEPVFGLLRDRLDHARIGVAEDCGAERTHVINEAVAVLVVEICARGGGDEQRGCINGLPCTHR